MRAHDAETLPSAPFPRRAPPVARAHTSVMQNKRRPRAPRPAPAPKRKEQETVEQLRASINQLVVAVNSALNQTSAALGRRIDLGFRKLEELIKPTRP